MKVKKQKQGRGRLTGRVQKKAVELFGEKITESELRFIPYLQYVMVNEQYLDVRKINQQERDILQKWKDKGYIEGGASGLSITKEFWDIMMEILFLAYVDID